MKRITIWEKWKNPLGGGKEYMTEEEIADIDEVYDDDPTFKTMPPVRPVIPTPGGLMPIYVYGNNNFGNSFNFWIMNTNFSVTDEVRTLLDHFPGVEVLDVVSPYKVRIGIGKCFDTKEVQDDIDIALNARMPCPNEENPDSIPLVKEMLDKVKELEALATQKYKHWVILIVPNGKVSVAHTDDANQYEDVLELYRQARHLAGGILFKSYENKY